MLEQVNAVFIDIIKYVYIEFNASARMYVNAHAYIRHSIIDSSTSFQEDLLRFNVLDRLFSFASLITKTHSELIGN